MKYKNAVPVIATADVRSAIDYYRDVLGFSEHFVFGEPPVYAGVQRDGVLLYITLDVELAASLKSPGLYPEIFLWVQNVDKASKTTRRAAQKYTNNYRIELGTRGNT